MTNIRFGLCCIFLEQPIKFRNTTVRAISGMERHGAGCSSHQAVGALSDEC